MAMPDESFGTASTAPSGMEAASDSSDDTTADSKFGSCGSQDMATTAIVIDVAL
jgi:hypothetical protein